MLDAIGQYLIHPATIAFQISNVLLYPVLLIEMTALAVVIFDAGLFLAELISRLRIRRSRQAIERTALAAKAALAAGHPAKAAATLATLRHGRFVQAFGRALVKDPDFNPVNLEKLVVDLEFAVSRRLERTRLLIRLGPILGLITTLIPISPALVGLAKGDVQTLSDNLVVAFSTTVVGLLIGGMGYLLTAVRERLYNHDISDVEYVLDTMEA